MTDIYNKKKRSQIMSRISGRETKPEIIVRKHLFEKGFRYKKNDETLPGKPDIVLPKYGVVILINGCFWHGHTCKSGTLPRTHNEFWRNKIETNVKRDKRINLQLKKQGWKVITIWQCKLRNRVITEKTLTALVKNLSDGLN